MILTKALDASYVSSIAHIQRIQGRLGGNRLGVSLPWRQPYDLFRRSSILKGNVPRPVEPEKQLAGAQSVVVRERTLDRQTDFGL